LPIEEEVINALGQHDIARDGQVQDLDARRCCSPDVPIDGLADLV